MRRNASTGTGTALAKSAASSSFARGVTVYLESGKRPRLKEAKLSELGELQEGEQQR
jgi:hypothetical protein